MSDNEKLPAETGSRKRLFAFGCAGIIGIALLCGIAATVINTFDNGDDDDVVAESDPTATPEPEPEPTATPETETVTITDAHIDATVEFMNDEPQVRDTSVRVDDDTIIIAVIVDAAVNEERAQDILDSAIRWLASQAAMSHYHIDSPSSDHYGGIWDHYHLQVGAGPNPDDFYARGAIAAGPNHLSWD